MKNIGQKKRAKLIKEYMYVYRFMGRYLSRYLRY